MAELNVDLIGITTFLGHEDFAEDFEVMNEASPENLAEFAGRACYQSFNKPNPSTRSNKDYLKHIIDSKHGSVLEHAQYSFYVTGVSRSLLAEITRHRHLNFSVLSQRFVNHENLDLVIPPAVKESHSRAYLESRIAEVAKLATEVYAEINHVLDREGKNRKQAREAARCVLPNASETKMVISGNARAWRDVLARRLDPTADAEIQEFAKAVLDLLVFASPNLFEDMV